MYDVALIGGGPAAYSASLNLKIRNKKFIVFSGNEKVTGLMKAPKIDNYLGMPGISGVELLKAYKRHCEEMDIEIKKEKIYNILSMGDYYALNAGNEFFDAKSIIIATGHAKFKYYEGEREYLGRGVGYCATCDGPLYRNKAVAIISENEEGEEEANFLSEICSKVYYVPMYKQELKLKDSIEVIMQNVSGIFGNKAKVNALKLGDIELNVDAVFIIRNVLPASQLIEGLELEDGSIKVDRGMATNLPGVFASGDCTGKPYQIAKAVGEGNIAALSAVKYLDAFEKQGNV